MMARFAQPGTVEAILLRPARRETVVLVDEVEIDARGLHGDHAPEGLRALTLVQAEHLPVIAALSGHDNVQATSLRRNIVVSGLNLLAFRNNYLRLGTALIEITGPCPPCSRMEEVLGGGGYNAMRGHGGVYAAVIEPGRLKVGDAVIPIGPEETAARDRT